MKWIITLHPVSISKSSGIRRVPFSPNKILQWSTKYKWKSAWHDQIGWACKEARVPKMEKAHVLVKLYSVKQMDRDNAYASCKPIFDGVVKAGILKDDKAEFCVMEVEQIKVNRYNDEKVGLEIESL